MRFHPRSPAPSPLPTPAPGASLVKQALWLRQDDGGLPGDTCGYLSGTSFIPATCEFGSTCAFDTANSAMGCCDTETSSCAIPTTCIPYSSMSGCLDDCQNNAAIFKCSDTSFPYCFTNTFLSPSAFGYGCEAKPNKGSVVLPTFVMTDVEGDLTTFVPVNQETNTNLVDGFTISAGAGFSDPAASVFTEPASSTGAVQSLQSHLASQSPGSSSSHSNLALASTPSASSSSSSSDDHSLSPGVIAAIVAPSILVVILLAGLSTFLCLCIRKRSRRRATYQEPIIGPYTQSPAPPRMYQNPYATSKEFVDPQASPLSHPSATSRGASPHWSSNVYPYPSGAAEMEGYDYEYHRPTLNRENLYAMARSSSGGPRRSDELARQRRLSEDGTTVIPEPSVAGRTNWTADSFNIAGGRRGGY